MYWIIERDKEPVNEAGAVSFDPSAVLRLGGLSNDLSWLSDLDPYRDRRVSETETGAFRRDFEKVLSRHTSEFFAGFARSKGMPEERLRRVPQAFQAAMDVLNKDPFYQTLKKVITLLETAEKQGLAVLVMGT